MIPVVEKFISINGEGTRSGELAAFIRLKGCNLSCSYCDTAWANDNNAPCKFYSAQEFADWAESSGVLNVTITGGEPLLCGEIGELCMVLAQKGLRAEIETNGSLPVSGLANEEYRPCFTLDYKLPSSGMYESFCADNIDFLQKNDTIKFVCGTEEDLDTAAEVIERYSLCDKCYVYFSPVFGQIKAERIVEFMKEKGLNRVRLQLQIHKYIWDPDKRGV